jgi:hypothetical protein
MMEAPDRQLRLRWHAGDVAAPDFRTQVLFYVDGHLVERSLAGSGLIRESVWFLPEVVGPRRISVQVQPPFVPDEVSAGDNPRKLGIFLHSQ